MLKSKPYDKSSNGKTQLYCPPMSEFDMLQTKMGAGEKETLGKQAGPAIMIVTQGSASMKANSKSYELKEGHVFFVAQGVELELKSKDGLLMHMAFVH